MAQGLEPVIVDNCKLCHWYASCKARKDAVEQARKSWFYHDGELRLEDRVDIAIIKLIQERGYEETAGDLIEVFGASRVVVEALLLFNTCAELRVTDFKSMMSRSTTHRVMKRLVDVGLVRMTGSAVWRINA